MSMNERKNDLGNQDTSAFDYTGDTEPQLPPKHKPERLGPVYTHDYQPGDLAAILISPLVAALALRSYFRDRHAWGSHPQANFIDRLVAKF